MPSPRLRTVDRDLRRLLLTVGDELRRARLNAGLSQAAVAAALGSSGATVSRVEAGRLAHLTFERAMRHAAAVGLVARVGLYPAGRAVRDQRQLRLEARYRGEIASGWGWRVEVGLPIAGDLRAVDVELKRPGCRIANELIVRLADVQAQLRGALLKQRDGGYERLIVVVADTHANRAALRLAWDAVSGSFPITSRSALAALRHGRDPGGNAIILL